MIETAIKPTTGKRGRCGFSAAHTVGAVFMGIVLYATLRGVAFLGAPALFPHLPHTTLLDALRYNAPDGLWLYGLLEGLRWIWGDDGHNGAWRWCAGAVTAACGSELLQRLHIIPGTFDNADLVAYALAAVLSVLRHHTFVTFKPHVI